MRGLVVTKGSRPQVVKGAALFIVAVVSRDVFRAAEGVDELLHQQDVASQFGQCLWVIESVTIGPLSQINWGNRGRGWIARSGYRVGIHHKCVFVAGRLGCVNHLAMMWAQRTWSLP